MDAVFSALDAALPSTVAIRPELVEAIPSNEPSPLDLLLEKARYTQLVKFNSTWKDVPKRIREAVLRGQELDQTDRILWAGWKKKLREIKDL